MKKFIFTTWTVSSVAQLPLEMMNLYQNSEFLLNLLTFFKMFNTYFLDILKVQKYNEHDPGLKLLGLVYFFSKKQK